MITKPMANPWMFLAAIGLTLIISFKADGQTPAPAEPSVLELPLNSQTASEPRFQLIAPPAGSMDKVEFTSDGLHIKQITEGGAGAKTSGFVLNAPSWGPFVLMLNFEVHKLEAPRANRAQGMWVRLIMEGDETPAFGLVASSKIKRGLGTTRAHNDSPKLQFPIEPLDFTKGTWIIERKGPELQLSIGETDLSYREIKRLPCSDRPLKEIQIWCSRQNFGNMPAEFTFKKLTFIGSDVLQQPPPAEPVFTIQRLVWTLVVGGILCALGVTGYRLYEKYR